MDILKGTTVWNGKDCGEIPFDDLQCKTLGIYFSAHWCPPCRGFTPKLVEYYNKINATTQDLEIVFVSSDRDENGMKGYFSEMPWKAVPFGKAEINTLKTKFDVSGIPKLVFLDQHGELIEHDGRSYVMKCVDDNPTVPQLKK